jgi:hypothetical protein
VLLLNECLLSCRYQLNPETFGYILVLLSHYSGLAAGWMTGVPFSTVADYFSLHHLVQTSSMTPPPDLLSNENWGLSPRKQSGRTMKLTTHLHLVPRLKMREAVPPLLQYVFIAWCLIK